MKAPTLTLLIQLAGLAHVGLICAGAVMPRVVNLRQHTSTLPPFIRQLFWTYYSFIGLCLVSFGLISLFMASELTSGTLMARACCSFLAAFWTLRLVAALFVLDVRPYLDSPARKIGYQVTNLVFIAMPIIYLLGAFN